jgi:hypothetical protein
LKPQGAAYAPGHNVTTGHGLIAFCEDGAGNRYRFRDRFVTPDVWHIGEPKSAWVVWYEIQAGYPPGGGNPLANLQSPSFRSRIARLLRQLADRIEG